MNAFRACPFRNAWLSVEKSEELYTFMGFGPRGHIEKVAKLGKMTAPRRVGSSRRVYASARTFLHNQDPLQTLGPVKTIAPKRKLWHV
jgi:hypothetical protein